MTVSAKNKGTVKKIKKIKKTVKKSTAAKSKKVTEEKTSSVKRQKRKVNLLRLCTEMNKYADDANDKEIIRRFKTSIISSLTDDISKVSLTAILKKPEDVDLSAFSESIQPYLKHYYFMIKRNKSRKK